MNKNDIIFITENKDGNFYIGYKIEVKRGIKGKTKSKIDELIIIGMKREKFLKFLDQNNMRLEYEKTN